MPSSQDTEITLGTTKLLSLFFGLVVVCAVFFALGYTLGRKSENPSGTSVLSPLPASNGAKPGSSASSSASASYKSAGQQSANPEPGSTPAAGSTEEGGAQPAKSSSSASVGAQSDNPPDPMAPIPTTGYFVQVAAVSKKDDAEALVDALKKKSYPAFVASNSTTDKLFRVQVGPFGDIKEAESTRSRLINDGYNPILKK
ncbi:MAG: SPOR domain-containing protein [Candidatus Sulfotelmatobacter sp.]